MAQVFLNNFITQIRAHRLQNGLSQAELAQMLHVSLRTYQRIESGEAYPSIEMVIKTTRELNFKYNDLFQVEDTLTKEREVLLRSMRMLERTTEMSRVGGWELNLDDNTLYWTAVTKEIHGVDELYVPSVDTAINFYKEGESRETIKRLLQNCIENGMPFSSDLVLITASGNEIRVIAQGVADFSDEKRRRVFGTFQDITERWLLESEKAKLVDDLNETQAFAGVGRWELDLSSGSLQWSDSLFEIFEIDRNKFKASYEAFLDLVHPDDRKMVDEAYKKSLKTREAYEIEHRLLMKDGRIKWLLERCRSTFDKEGKPLVSVGCAQDVTRFKSIT